MTPVNEAAVAALVLRLLLEDPSARGEMIDWRLVGGLARRDRVAQRLAAALERRGAQLPERFADAVERARARTDCVVRLAGRLSETCKARDIPHVFYSLEQHYPDTGPDLDVLVAAPASTDDLLLDRLPAVPMARRLQTRLAEITGYRVPECDTVIDLHHRRLGRLGEHARLAALLLRRRRLAQFKGVPCRVPSLEDQLLLQGLAHLARWPALRLADVYWTITTLRKERIDWNTLIMAAVATGLLAGVGCHLHFAEQIHQELFGRRLLDAAVRARLGTTDWGRVEFRGGCYRFSTVAGGRLFLRHFRAELRLGDWAAAARLCLVPLVAATAAWHRRRAGLHPHVL